MSTVEEMVPLGVCVCSRRWRVEGQIYAMWEEAVKLKMVKQNNRLCVCVRQRLDEVESE